MKSISAALDNHIQEQVTTLCTCWRIVRLDGQEFFFTNLDKDIEFPVGSGDIYLTSIGLSKTNLSQDSTLGVSNTEIIGVFNSDDLSQSDLLNGLFNFATMFSFIVNYEDLTQGELKQAKSTFGEITLTDTGVFTVEQRGITQVLKQQNMIDTYGAECSVDLGSVKCGFPIIPPDVQRNTSYIIGEFVRKPTTPGQTNTEDYNGVHYKCTVTGTTDASDVVYSTVIGNTTVDGTASFITEASVFIAAEVLSITDNRKFKVIELTPAMTFPDGHFNGGAIVWDTGNNKGSTTEVKFYLEDDGITIEQDIELYLAPSFAIQVGDKLGIYPGCDKFFSTCKDKFDNIENFRGFPDVPGPAFVPVQIPKAKQ